MKPEPGPPQNVRLSEGLDRPGAGESEFKAQGDLLKSGGIPFGFICTTRPLVAQPFRTAHKIPLRFRRLGLVAFVKRIALSVQERSVAVRKVDVVQIHRFDLIPNVPESDNYATFAQFNVCAFKRLSIDVNDHFYVCDDPISRPLRGQLVVYAGNSACVTLGGKVRACECHQKGSYCIERCSRRQRGLGIDSKCWLEAVVVNVYG